MDIEAQPPFEYYNLHYPVKHYSLPRYGKRAMFSTIPSLESLPGYVQWGILADKWNDHVQTAVATQKTDNR